MISLYCALTSKSLMLINLSSSLHASLEGKLKAILSVALVIVASATFGPSAYGQSNPASDSETLNQQRDLYRQSI